MLLTKHNQTPFELASEFVNNVRGVTNINADLVALSEAYINIEKTLLSEDPADQENADRCRTNLSHSIEHVGNNPNSMLNGRTVAFIKNCNPNVSDALLSWICSQSESNPEYINVVLGLYATYFYKYNSKDTIMTFKWLQDTVGKGKIFNYENIFPWYIASKGADGKCIFEVMQPDDLYLAN